MEAQTEFLPPPEVLPVSQWVCAVRFVIPGKPEQRGSKVPIVLYDKRTRLPRLDKHGRVILMAKDDNPRSEAYMRHAARFAKRAMAGREPLNCPVAVAARFYFKRHKNHFGTGRNAYRLRDDAPECHTRTPDLDKLFRCLGDALTGVVYVDDKLITATPGMRKYWGHPARTEVQIFIRPDDHAKWLAEGKF